MVGASLISTVDIELFLNTIVSCSVLFFTW